VPLIEVETMLERAARARGLPIRYALGRGGRKPAAESPADAKGR
jgi:hypothetical protein